MSQIVQDGGDVQARLEAAYAETGSIRAAARKVGVAASTACKRLKGKKAEAAPAAEECPVARERQRASREASRKDHVSAVREAAFRDFLAELVGEHVRPMLAVPSSPRPPRPAKAHHRHPLLVMSDWHFEERVNGAGVMGLNHYDVPTACKRAWRVVHAAMDWKRDAEAGGRFAVDELTVVLNGDMLTGTLHGLERHSSAPNIVRAALACGDLLAAAIADLAEGFGRVRVIGVAGNHGRLPDDRKVPTKDPTRSWDYVAYQVARRRLANYGNVAWHLPEAYGALFEVAGHLCYATHGNFIPNSLGVVGYGMRRFGATLAGNLQSTGRALRYVFAGHWHAPSSSEFAGVEAFICPSLIGTQEYTFLSGGAVTRSAQDLFVFDRTLGCVTRERLYGEGPGYEGTYQVEL